GQRGGENEIGSKRGAHLHRVSMRQTAFTLGQGSGRALFAGGAIHHDEHSWQKHGVAARPLPARISIRNRPWPTQSKIASPRSASRCPPPRRPPPTTFPSRRRAS